MKNPAFLEKKSSYYNQANEFLISLIPDGPNVIMDLGCASGQLGQKLLEMNKAVELVGVEIFVPAAREASKYYDFIHVGDIEELNLDYNEHFDVVICGDILEHLKEPYKVLKKIHCWLKNGGRIICCIPNIRYWRIWRDVIFKGIWEYSNEGILDYTHLRFFTTRSFKKMLVGTSFLVEHEELRIADGPKQQAFNRLTLGIFKEFLGYQLVFSAGKTDCCNTESSVALIKAEELYVGMTTLTFIVRFFCCLCVYK